MALLTLALIGCEPEAPVVVQAPVTAAPPPPTVTIWTEQNIRELVPTAAPRTNAVPKPIPALPDYDVALATLGAVIDRYDGDPDSPWAVAHGLLARGRDFRISDGREAVPHIFANFAEPRMAGQYTLMGFPAMLGAVRVEPHTDLLLKNFAEVGVDPAAVYTTKKGQVPIADLYRWTLLKTHLVPSENKSSFTDPGDISWNLQALANWAPSQELQWIALDGTPMDLDDLTTFSTAVLLQESGFMIQAMNKGQRFDRTGQPLFSYPCGASHLVQGVSYAVARGFGSPKDRKVVDGQVPLLFYRLPIELAIYDDAVKKFSTHRLKLSVQRMKFLGHWLETVSKMQAMGLFVPSPAQLTQIEGAAQNLVLTVDSLKKQGAFDTLDTLRAKDEQIYLDIIGDAGHAVRGLELALGRGKVNW